MRVLIVKLLSVKSKLNLKSTRPKDKAFVDGASKGKTIELPQLILAFICVEKKDENRPNLPEIAAEKIVEIFKKNSEPGWKLSLIPFAHLTKEIADPRKAYIIIKEVNTRLYERLNDKYFPEFNFGWHRDLYMKMKGGLKNTHYLEI